MDKSGEIDSERVCTGIFRRIVRLDTLICAKLCKISKFLHVPVINSQVFIGGHVLQCYSSWLSIIYLRLSQLILR